MPWSPARISRAKDQGESPRLILRRSPRQVLIDGAGHWNQQEAPAETNAALVEFLPALADERIRDAAHPAAPIRHARAR